MIKIFINIVLNRVRMHIGKKYKLIDESKLSFVWVTDFPLLEYSKEDKRWK